MRRGLVCGVWVLIGLAITPATAQADLLGGLFRGVTAAPRAVMGGLFGGARGRHHSHAVRRESSHRNGRDRTVARESPESQPATRDQRPLGGWLGAVYWPSAYRDTFRYIMSGANDADAFWAHSGDDIYDSLFVPAMASTMVSDKSLDIRSACADDRSDAVSLETIQQMLRPDDDVQRARLDALRSALATASERVHSSCNPSPTGLAPTARLESMWDRLRALRQAVGLVRAPLKAFYDSLSDEQKARLNARSDRPQRDDVVVCGESTSRGLEWPAKQIEEAVRPSDQQRASLGALASTTSHLSALLEPSCPPRRLITPTGRLEAVANRLDAMIYAVTLERTALNNFYVSLDDHQKTRFGAEIGQPQAAGGHPAP